MTFFTVLGTGQINNWFHGFERFNISKVNLADSETLGNLNLVPVKNFNDKFRIKSRRLLSILSMILFRVEPILTTVTSKCSFHSGEVVFFFV